MKRTTDITVAMLLLAATLPVMALAALAIWLSDFRSPFYVAERQMNRRATFRMLKLRTMVHGADRLGGPSTSQTDPRLTRVGQWLRSLKLDEVPQLLNVLRGQMSLVGPRPQVLAGVSRYSEEEWRLLDVPPGITDFASIVFADEGQRLAGEKDVDEAYDRLIRPGKSRLGLFYAAHHSVSMDLCLIGLTALTLVSRERALRGVQWLLRRHGAGDEIVDLARSSQSVSPIVQDYYAGR